MIAEHKKPGLGSGIYSYSEAARLLNVSTSKVRAWSEGYVRKRGEERVLQRPVLQGGRESGGFLTFQDLIELMFVKELRNAGVELATIRAAAQVLSEELQTPYPFAHERLVTDGAQLLREHGSGYQSVADKQHVFAFVAQFFKDIIFEDREAVSWLPMGKDRPVLVDPHRSFGAPIETSRGVRTDVIYSAYEAEDHDAQLVAEWYDIPLESVQAAVEFEQQWQRKEIGRAHV